MFYLQLIDWSNRYMLSIRRAVMCGENSHLEFTIDALFLRHCVAVLHIRHDRTEMACHSLKLIAWDGNRIDNRNNDEDILSPILSTRKVAILSARPP